jgi:hypothetical protein
VAFKDLQKLVSQSQREIVEISDDNREKLQAMELFKDAHTWSTLIEGTKLADNFHFPMK